MPCSTTWLTSTKWWRAVCAITRTVRLRGRHDGRRQHACERLEQGALRRGAVGRFGEHQREPPTQQRIPHCLSGELDRERNEPGRSPGSGARARYRGILLEQRQQKGALGGKLAVDGAFGEAGSCGHFVQGRRLDAALGEELQASLEEQRSRLGLAPLMNDPHWY